MHMFRQDRELLELNAMEMDASLVKFFEERLTVNLKEKLLRGRGIKGVFAPYEDAKFLVVRTLSDGKIQISALDKPSGECHTSVNLFLEEYDEVHI
jgi:glucokinase